MPAQATRSRPPVLWAAAFTAALASAPARPHDTPLAWAAAWNIPPDLLIGVGILAWWYLAGLWRQRGRGHASSLWKHSSFFGGLLLLAIAPASPLDALADRLFFMQCSWPDFGKTPMQTFIDSVHIAKEKTLMAA